MPNYTTNLNLEKPLQSEQYNIDVFNANADKIDQFAGQVPARALTADKLTTGAKINGVNFKGDTDITLPTVNTSGNQTVGGIKTFSEVIQGTVDKAIKDQNGDVIDETYVKNSINKWHALKAYLDKGELLTDAEGLNAVKTMAHSTFDLSKFDVVGSPVITDDGVASGFSRSNYIRSNFSITPATSLIIESEFDIGNTTPQTVYSINSNDIPRVSIESATQIRLAGFGIGLNVTVPTLTSGTKVKTKATITSDKLYKLEVFINGNTYQNSRTEDSISFSAISFVTLGGLRNGGYPFTGQIDLSHFSIEVDGVPVFSGNKTGYDIIKDDNYTVVGSPTISADRVASGFSDSNYVYSDINITSNNTFKISCTFTTSSIRSNSNKRILKLAPNSRLMICDADYLRVWLGEGSSWNVKEGWQITTSQLAGDTKYKIDVEYTGTEYKVYLNNELKQTYSSNINILQSITNIYFGYDTSSTSNYFTGTIDLNAFKIYVDGKLVYQPCLYIPYTEASNGAEIVNSIYRDRINSVVEYTGSADYFTLSDTDFTLPIDNVYAKKSTGTTTIVGHSSTNGLTLSNPAITQGQVRTTNDNNAYTPYVFFKGKDGKDLAHMYYRQLTSGLNELAFVVTLNDNTDMRFSMGFDADGNARCLAPASDTNGTVVTTVGHSYGNNGYCKLGNGLIVQWGRTTMKHQTDKEITFPTAFTTKNYSVALTAEKYTSTDVAQTDDMCFTFNAISATKCTIYPYDAGGNTYTAYVRWIAIGY